MRRVVQLVVGLDGAGKTSLCLALQGCTHLSDPSPTIGFNAPCELILDGHPVTLYDVGGSKGIRGIWSEYLSEVHALIFVVDSAAAQRFAEAADALNELVTHKYGVAKSVLVLANKADMDGASSAASFAKRLEALQDTSPCASLESWLRFGSATLTPRRHCGLGS